MDMYNTLIEHTETCHLIYVMYRKWGKSRWPKHLRFQPYEVFHENTFTMS